MELTGKSVIATATYAHDEVNLTFKSTQGNGVIIRVLELLVGTVRTVWRRKAFTLYQ